MHQSHRLAFQTPTTPRIYLSYGRELADRQVASLGKPFAWNAGGSDRVPLDPVGTGGTYGVYAADQLLLAVLIRSVSEKY